MKPTFKTYGISASFTIMHNICVLRNMLIWFLGSMFLLLLLLILYLHIAFCTLKFGGKLSLLHRIHRRELFIILDNAS